MIVGEMGKRVSLASCENNNQRKIKKLKKKIEWKNKKKNKKRKIMNEKNFTNIVYNEKVDHLVRRTCIETVTQLHLCMYIHLFCIYMRSHTER